MILKVKAKPGSSVSSVKKENGALVVRVKSVPERGRANEEMFSVLAEFLGISRSRLKLLRGAKNKYKLVEMK